jgi:anti-sigma B factor antagonist
VHDGQFAVEASFDGHRAVLAVHGEIDMATADGLRDAIEDAARSGAGEVWVDLTDVGFMDSTGLSALVSGHRTLDGRIAVICPDGAPRRAIEISGLHEVLRIHAHADEAGTH